MIDLSYDDRDQTLCVVYRDSIHLQDMYELIRYGIETPSLPDDLKIYLDIRKGTYAFPVNELTLVNIGLDQVIERFDSITIASVRNSNENIYDEFMAQYCKRIGIHIEGFYEEDSARYYLKKLSQGFSSMKSHKINDVVS